MSAKILLVDDEAVLRHSLTFSLEQEGFTVLSAEDGLSALELAERERPDLVVLDIIPPLPRAGRLGGLPPPAAGFHGAGDHVERAGKRDRQGARSGDRCR
jgi:CheY-like chemotaxis protein